MSANAAGEPEIVIRDAGLDDLPTMAAIYDEQVGTSLATFDTEPRGAAYLGEKLASAGGSDIVLVARAGDEVLGYAYSGPFRPRPAYAGTKEVSVYLAVGARRRGLGRALYAELLARLDARPDVHTQVAVVALPNDASEALHRAVGFEQIGVLREVGHKFGRYVDTAWYQRMASGG
ncbi:GNAT family N-acetyltransferase [Nostocoides sp. HKS02]|uniref:GNAT family N-acetyltransferase n=1 Tax=Nostocoides sp. HKS02 TaxID=1813880 RepID=UPI0012B4FD40|nr:GNAT family N-acetyltransferase [Tetrasphaera sp. HKS02]QGN57689.1 GNAT family N-acetyltransferase [Tetrasphaera sp. HKS02]